MATIVNDRDVLLQAATPRNSDPSAGKALILTADTPAFRVATGGAGTPTLITLKAQLVNIKAVPTWGVTGASGLTVAGDSLSATLAFADMTANTAIVTLTAVYLGVTYTQTLNLQKIFDGVSGLSNATVNAYKRSATTPTDNPGDVTYTFASGAITTPATDALANGWTKTIPAGTNPLYVVVASAAASTATDTILAAEWTAPVVLATSTAALNTATLFIYQRLSAATPVPSAPSASATYTFNPPSLTGLNNGWSTAIPSSGGAYLFVTTATAANTTATDSIAPGEWAPVSLLAQDGPAGSPGTAGQQSARPGVYQWGLTASGPPGSPTGSATYTWATGLFGAAPTTPTPWFLTPPVSPGSSYTLWRAEVPLTTIATNTSTGFSWTSSSIFAVGASGAQGPQGPTGATGSTGGTGSAGNSARYAYSAVNGFSLATSPSSVNTSGSSSFPSTGTWGETAAWQSTVPSIGANQALFQIDGVYQPASGITTWTAPYLSSLKVGSLSAISANLGTITAGSITSATYASAASGQRVTLNESSSNTFRAYNSSSVMICEVGGTSGAVYVPSTSGLSPAINASAPSTAGGAVIAANCTGAGYGVASSATTGRAFSGTTSSAGAYVYYGSGETVLYALGRITIPTMPGGTGTLTTNFVVPFTDNTYSSGIGSNRWTSIFAVNNVIQTSDRRLKTDIEDLESEMGLGLILGLRPVQYRMRVGQNDVVDRKVVDDFGDEQNVVDVVPRAGVRLHYGLISQEVKEQLGERNVSIWSLDDKNDPESTQALQYTELISPLILAIQQLNAKLEAQGDIIADLQARLESQA